VPNQGATVSFVIVDVLVDGLMTNGERSVYPQVVGDLLWAPVLVEQSDDLFPAAQREVKAAARAAPPCRCITVGQIRTIPAIYEFFVALNFSTDSAGGALESTGNLGVGAPAYPKLSDVVPFVLEILSIVVDGKSRASSSIIRFWGVSRRRLVRDRSL
jgi:hypothetical protein